ncbi:MAG: hypothetical protein NDJ18_08065 [candidate division Zixibacteria bacterium]|nr:hypothetical protein [candidate division Zixibacteria bacterium]
MTAFLRAARKLISFSIILSSIAASLVSAQDQKTFRVDSYIPQRFEDWGLKVEGGASLSGSNDEDRSGSTYNRSRDDYSAGRFNFFASTDYKFQTPLRSIVISSGFQATLEDRDDEYSTAQSNGYNSSYTEESQTEYSSYSLYFTPRADILSYLRGDFFGSVRGSMNLQMRQSLDGSAETDREDLRRFVDGTIVESHSSEYESSYGRNRSISGTVSLGMGIGRKYEGRYGAVALALVDELHRNGLVAKEPTYEQMQAICDILFGFLNEHQIDSRIFRIEKLGSVLEFLKEQGITEDLGATGPFLLEDIVSYYPKFSREFGSRLRVGIGGEWYLDRSLYDRRGRANSLDIIYYNDSASTVDTITGSSSYTSSSSEHYSTQMPFIFLMGEYSYPISLRWQFNSVVEMRSYFEAVRQLGNREARYSDYYGVNAQLGVTCVIDTRTYASLTVWSEYRAFTAPGLYNNNSPSADEKQHEVDYSVRANLQYRISVPTALSLSGSIDGYGRKLADYDVDTDQLQYNVGVRLSHWLF